MNKAQVRPRVIAYRLVNPGCVLTAEVPS